MKEAIEFIPIPPFVGQNYMKEMADLRDELYAAMSIPKELLDGVALVEGELYFAE